MGPVGPCKPSQRREGRHTEAMWGPPESGVCQGLRVVYTALGAAILRLQCGAAVGAVFSGLYLSSAVGSLGLPPDLLARLPAPGLVAGCRLDGGPAARDCTAGVRVGMSKRVQVHSNGFRSAMGSGEASIMVHERGQAAPLETLVIVIHN
jgi:hypothetical protein